MKLVSENTVSFTRINNKLCTEYKIYMVTSSGQEILVEEMKNPIAPIPLKESKNLEFKENKVTRVWDLPKDSILHSSNSVTLYINGEIINTNYYTVSSKNKKLYIDYDIAITDKIKIEYFLDRLVFKHNSTESCKYKIIPIITGYKLGQHSVL